MIRVPTSSLVPRLAASLASIVAVCGCGGAGTAPPNGAGGGSSASSGSSTSAGWVVPGGGGAQSSSHSSTTSAAADVCSGKGPVVTIPGTAGTIDMCTGSLAETRFLNALCTCNDATVAGYLRTRGFDSRRGPSSSTNIGGGSVGINHDYVITTGYTDVGGSFTIAGSDAVSFAGYLEVGENLSVAGNATVAGYTNVHGNARFGGSMLDIGPVKIDGDLYQNHSVMATPLIVSGKRYQQAVTVANPCPCEPTDLLDVGALVDDAKIHNDNAAGKIDPTMFNNVVGTAETTLTCGRYYIEQMGGVGSTLIHVEGRVALFVDGSIGEVGKLEFQLAQGAEIDIFVRNNLTLTGFMAFGSKDRPAASRIYVGGKGDVTLVGAAEFVGNLYAPQSLVTAIGYVDVYGSIFARDFQIPGFANFVYDSAIQHAGDSCGSSVPPPPAGSCKQCGTCAGGTACVGGSCGTCTSDSDCCSPLTCQEGGCVEAVAVPK